MDSIAIIDILSYACLFLSWRLAFGGGEMIPNNTKTDY